MQPRDFVYWLQGFFELSGTDTLTEEQVGEIKRHLKMVFVDGPDIVFNPPEGCDSICFPPGDNITC